MQYDRLSPLCLRDIRFRNIGSGANTKPRVEERIINRIKPDCYIEPFGWTGELFFNKEPSNVEVYNDYGMLYAILFDLLKDAKNAKLIASLFESLYDGYEPSEYLYRFCADVCKIYLRNRSINVIERYLKGSRAENYKLFHAEPVSALGFATVYGFYGSRNIMTPFEDFCDLRKLIPTWSSRERMKERVAQATEIQRFNERFKDVQIETIDPVECIQKYDKKDALFFIYPPQRTPQDKRYFRRWDDNDDKRLLETLKTLKGRAILSLGTRNVKSYDSLFDFGWRMIETDLVENIPLHNSFYVFVKV